MLLDAPQCEDSTGVQAHLRVDVVVTLHKAQQVPRVAERQHRLQHRQAVSDAPCGEVGTVCTDFACSAWAGPGASGNTLQGSTGQWCLTMSKEQGGGVGRSEGVPVSL